MILGIDTSNYTTSVAAFHPETGIIYSSRRMVDVDVGKTGARQSDVVFQHVKYLPGVLDNMLRQLPGNIVWDCIGVSHVPRRAEGSYMPCFLPGETIARSMSAVCKVPLVSVSHQEGHIAAGIWSSGRTDLLQSEFLVWHLSGGTTELLHVIPDDEFLICADRIGGTSDLTAGQLIDRVGVKAGLPFPAGVHLEVLSEKCSDKIPPKFSVNCLEGSFSGLQNRAEALMHNPPQMADFVINSIALTVKKITDEALRRYARLPLLCVGGVFCNKTVRKTISEIDNTFFALPEYSSDNAAGVAYLAALRLERQKTR